MITHQQRHIFGKTKTALLLLVLFLTTTALTSCTDSLPGKVHNELLTPQSPEDKYSPVNRNHASPITYVKLDNDVLRPIAQNGSMLPFKDHVGPFDMREETLAGALELVLADKKISMAYQTNKVTTNTVTVSGLQGPLDEVVNNLCGLANLYCTYEDGALVVKEVETFTVSLPPMIADDYAPFVNGVQAITGGQTYVDVLTRSLTYTTNQLNHRRAVEYFDRLRANTAMIVYEIQIWEVQLSDRHQTGVDWNALNAKLGSYGLNLTRDGAPSISGAMGVGVQYTGTEITADAVLNFLQTQGAVKTVSQPQLTVLSGSRARLRVGNRRDYVSQITRTVGVNTADNVSVATSRLETGLNLEINSAWDNSTVYGGLRIDLQNLIRLGSLDVGTTSIQLPETSDRSIDTRIRVRPGDAVIIGGIVEERSTLDQTGLPGKSKPLFATSKDNQGTNTELVFMLRPRVVVYTNKLPDVAQLNQGDPIKVEPQRGINDLELLPSTPVEPAPVVPQEPVKEEKLLPDSTVPKDAVKSPVIAAPTKLVKEPVKVK